jgi:thymidine phosphorylase
VSGAGEQHETHRLKVRHFGLDTQSEAVIFLRKDSPICRAEGFTAHARVLLRSADRHVIATLYQINGPLIAIDEAVLSDMAWNRLGLKDGDTITVAHHEPLDSLGLVRSRIYGKTLDEAAMRVIINDIVDGKYSDIHISAFITACATRPLVGPEVLALTRAMVSAGDTLSWGKSLVVDKHSVGGLPGNRTTPIIVSIAAALGLTMPKTSSRAITSPAGTADMMETLAPVALDVASIHRVVEQEGGCIVWGGAVNLSPADDILIRVERALDIDTEGQMIASVISKKVAAGATHLVLDLPLGVTAKVRTPEAAQSLTNGLMAACDTFGIRAKVVPGKGDEPIGRGLGPSLEARDVLEVLQAKPGAPRDLRDRAVVLAGALLELAGAAPESRGKELASRTIDDGRAWAKFQRICEAQGGMREPPVSTERHAIAATRSGRLGAIDNRKIGRLAKLAGAPDAKAAGVELHARLDDIVVTGQPLCTVHADAPGELAYALSYATANIDMFRIEDV